jgi:hypothetical protein
MRFVIISDGRKFTVHDTVDPDGDVSGISTIERAEKIAARLNTWLDPVN